MPPARSLLLIAVVGLLSSSAKGARAASPAEAVSASAVPDAQRALPIIGVMADAGLPDGANLSLVVRPLSWLRTQVGGGYNMVSPGVRIGLSLLPFGWGPSGTLEAGHYFDGNANGLAQKLAGSSFHSALLERVGYDYANAHLGLDFGARRVTFFIHGGMSYVRASVHNLDSVVASQTGSTTTTGSGTTQVSIKQDPTVKAWFPSAKLGLVVYF